MTTACAAVPLAKLEQVAGGRLSICYLLCHWEEGRSSGHTSVKNE